MSTAIVYIDHSEVRAGQLEALRLAIDELVAFVRANEPQLIAYNFYLSEDGRQMSVVAVHPDAASLALHMRVAGPLFGRFQPLIRLTRIEAYGELGAELRTQLQKKAELLGAAEVRVLPRHAGFARFGAG